jgi:hypothetical protein
MADVLEKAEKATANAIKWVAAEFSFFRDARDDIREVKNNPSQGGNKIRKARSDFRYGSRSEFRAEREEEKVEASLKELAGKVPPNLKSAILSAEHRIEVEVNQLIKFSSRYTGHMREKIDSLAVQVELLEKGKGNVEIVEREAQELIDKLNDVIEWIEALLIDLKKAKNVEDRIESWLKG